MVDFAKHLKAIRQSAAPNLNPTPRKEAKPSEVVPDLRDLVEDSDERKTIMQLTEMHAVLGAEERAAKKAKDAIGVRLKPLCNDYALLKVQVGDIRLNYYLITRSTIIADKLRERGVSQAVINACTVETKAWALRTSLPGVNDEGDE